MNFKNYNSWSILIWTIFLSLFISAFFIAFQSWISKYFTFSSLYNKNIEEYSELNDALLSLKKNPQIFININNYNLESLDYNGASYSWFLNYNEATEYWITNSWWTSIITWSVISWGPLLYKLISLDTSSIFDSWIINTSNWINLSTGSGILYIQSLGSFSNFNIDKWKSDLLPAKNTYKLTKNISWYNKFLWNLEITNFWIKSYPTLDYESLWMYLNTNQ